MTGTRFEPIKPRLIKIIQRFKYNIPKKFIAKFLSSNL